MTTPSQSPSQPGAPGSRTPDLPARDQLSGHEYDGIQEYDNPTPGWWVALFVASVVFAVGYFVYYHSQVPDRSIYDRYQEATGELAKKKLAALGITQLAVTEANMAEWVYSQDERYKAYRSYGESVFKANCTSCHGGDAQGLVGPNLTDDYYKNIKKITDIPRVITSGANNGAMPPKGGATNLSDIDIALVGTYVASLRGTNHPGKAPIDGDIKIAPWPAYTPPASAPGAKTQTAPTTR